MRKIDCLEHPLKQPVQDLRFFMFTELSSDRMVFSHSLGYEMPYFCLFVLVNLCYSETKQPQVLVFTFEESVYLQVNENP